MSLLDPVQQSPTIYDVFVARDQEKRQEKSVDQTDTKDGKVMANGGQKKKTIIKNGKKPDQSRKKKTFEEALSEVNLRCIMINIIPDEEKF